MSIDRQKVIDTAQKFAAKGQFDKAIVEYMRIVKEDPSDVRILLKIGDLQVRKGSKDDAIATYSRVAKGYDEQGFYLKAIAVYKQILSIDPNLTELYSKLADLYVKLGLVPDALSNLDALATRYLRAGADDKLVAVYRQMVDIDASNVPSRIKLAELFSKLGKNDDAAREFEAGGKLLRDAGRADDWAKVSERLLFHRPNDVALARDLAKHYLERQDAKRALPKLQVCFKSNPKDVDTLEMLAAAFRELGQLPKTISVLKEIARIHAEAGRHEKKLDTWRRVLELAPTDTEARDGLKGSSRLARRPSSPDGTGSHAAHPAPSTETGARKAPVAPSTETGARRAPVAPATAHAAPTASAPGAAAETGARKAPAPAVVPPPVARPQPAPPPPEPTIEEAEEEIPVVDEEVIESLESVRPPPAMVAPPPAIAAPPVMAPPPAMAAPPPAAVAPPIKEHTAPIPLAPARVERVEPIAARRAPTADPLPLVNPIQPVAPPPVAPPPGPADVTRILGEADIFIKYGLKQKAIAHLSRAIELDPGSVDALVRLRDLYADTGDGASSARMSVQIAELYAEGDPATALGEVTRALELDPNNEYAVELYHRLNGSMGVAAVEEQYATTAAHDPYEAAAAAYAAQDPYASHAPDLPGDDLFGARPPQHRSYEVPQLDPEAAYAQQDAYDAHAQGYADADTYAAQPQGGYDVADPYAAEHTGHDPAAAYGQQVHIDHDAVYAEQDAYAAHAQGYAEQEGYTEQLPPTTADAHPHAGGAAVGGGGAAAGGDIEEGLDEAEFFVTQGLYDDARESLQNLLALHPNHPLVIERLEELESLMQAQMAPEDDRAFALAEKLAEEVDQVQQASGPQFNDGGEMIDVETVFAQFKKGVDRVISPDDADTHFDLGTAYKEMGLVDDAINEFKISAQNPKKSTLAETMIGLCHMERGDLPGAIDCFRRALQSPSKSEREELALYFELGNAYETAGDLSEALYFLQKVEKRDPQFRNVRQRVQRISARVNSGARAQPSATDDRDEVDRAFDDLLKG